MTETPIVLQSIQGIENLPSGLIPDRKRLYRENRELEETVRTIIDQVIEGGDQACRELTTRFDRVDLPNFRVSPEAIECAAASISSSLREALKEIIGGIRDFHTRQRSQSWWYQRDGAFLGEHSQPIQTVAAYVPGGRYPYPSSVMMTVIPAQLAGVPRLFILTPPGQNGEVTPEILATAHLLGVDEIYRLGGAQAVAAACFGTESIPQADLIVGPGNRYVTAAKNVLQGIVGIDSLAGPSEVVILAEPPVHPEWVAFDLLAQAEHDPIAQAILISPDQSFLVSVRTRLEQELAALPLPFHRESPIYLFQTRNRQEAWSLARVLAPEHLEIMTPDEPELPTRSIRAGALFIGERACVALGDYGFGPNHVIPTSGRSAFSSPLSVRDYITTSTFLSLPDALPSVSWQTFARLARVEGLFYHEKSLLTRQAPPRPDGHPSEGGELDARPE